MRRIVYLLTFLFIASFRSEAQVNIIAPNISISCGGTTACVAITVDNFTDISGVQFTFSWDETVLDYVTVKQLASLPDLDANDYNESFVGQGDLTFAWFTLNPAGGSLNTGDTLMAIEFNIIGGPMSALEFNSSITGQLVTGIGSFPPPVVPAAWIDGMITIGGNDTNPPAINNCPNNISVANSPGQCGATVTWTEPTATDDCDPNPSISPDMASGSFFDVGTTTVTYTATDNAGNSSTCSFTVTVNDTEAPMVDCPMDLTVTAPSGSSSAIVTGIAPTVTDNCPSNTSTTWTATNGSSGNDDASGTSFPIGTTTVTYSTTDGNATDMCSFNITVEQGSTPQPVTFIAETLDLQCGSTTASVDVTVQNFIDVTGFSGTISWNTSVIDFTSISNINGNLPDLNISNFGQGDVANGNLTFGWIDGDISGEMLTDNEVLFTLNFDIVGSPTSAISFNSSVTSQLVTGVGGFPPPVIPANWIDGVVNVTTDLTPPVIAGPSDITINCTDSTDPSNTGNATATDNCDPNPTVTFSDVVTPGSCPDNSEIARTFTATDAAGNSSIFTQTITIEDTDAPSLSIPADATLDCTEATDPSNTGMATATDNCTVTPTVSFSDVVVTDPSCPQNITITRTWTATDSCGNATSLDQTISVSDTQAPSLSIPADVTLDCVDSTDPSNTGMATATDNCVTTAIITFNDVVITDPSCPQNKTITRTWTATDSCGNATSLDQSISVSDTQAPTFDPPADLTISCGDVFDPSNTGMVQNVRDNCSGILDTTFSDNSSTVDFCSGNSTITRTWTVRDSCGNQAVRTQTITISGDKEAPTFQIPDDVTIDCSDDPDDLTITGNITNVMDDCSGVQDTSYTDNVTTVVGCGPSGLIVRTWTVTDSCGKSASFDQNITIEDTEDPTFAPPAPITLSCEVDNTDLSISGNPTGLSDNCDTSLDVTFSDDLSTLTGCNNTGTFTRTFTVTDDCGNSATGTQLITITDNVDPTFTEPADVTISCDNDPLDLSITGDVTDENDNCSTNLDATFSDDNSNLTGCSNTGFITRTWTLSDDCNNTVTKTQQITVVDNENPTFTPPADITFDCFIDFNDLTLTGDVTDEADNCSTGLDAAFTDVVISSNTCDYLIQRTWTLRDACGNLASFVQRIAVIDDVNPTFTVPADVTFDCDVNINDLSLTGDVTDEDDNCSTNLDATFSDNMTGDLCSSGIERTWTLTDDCGNTNTQVQIITIRDDIDPEFTVPADLTLACAADATDLSITGDVTDESDNCASNLDASFSDSNSGNFPCNGTITRTWSLTDDCNNTTTKIQTITVLDDTNPTFTVPADITLTCNQSFTDLSLTGDVTDEADNCSTNLDASFSDDVQLGGCSSTGSVTRTWTLTDDCGNTNTQVQTITIADTEAPVARCKDITVQLDNNGEAFITGTMVDDGSTDNCTGIDGLSLTVSPNQFDCDDVGPNTVTLSMMDICGNMASCTAIVTVEDNIAPSVECPGDMSFIAPMGDTSVVVNNINFANESDNCSVTAVRHRLTGATSANGIGDISGTAFNLGTTQVQYIAVDPSGNTDTCSFEITILGAVQIECPDNQSHDTEAGVCDAAINNLELTIIDGQNIIRSIEWELSGATTGTGTDDVSGQRFNLGTTLVTYTVTDLDGITTRCSFEVTINDNERPNIDCPSSIVVDAPAGACSQAISSGIAPMNISDNCGVDSVVYVLSGATTGRGLNNATNTNFFVGTTNVAYTVYDVNGNSLTCSFNVTVNDVEDPMITCPTDQTIVVSPGTSDTTVNNLTPTATDNCQIDNITYTLSGATTGSGNNDASGETFNLGTTTVTYTATDEAGNSATCSFTVTVTEQLGLVCPTDQNVATDAGLCTAIVNNIEPTILSNPSTISSITYTLSGATTGSGTDDASGETFNLGTTTVTYTITNNNNETESCSFEVTVIDEEAPSISCPSDLTVTTSGGSAIVSGAMIPASITDNCTLDQSFYRLSGATTGTGSIGDITINDGVTTVTYVAVDAAGNRDSCSFQITGTPGTVDLIDCPADQTFYSTANSCDVIISGVGPILLVNSSQISSITYQLTGGPNPITGNDDASGNSLSPGTYTLTYTATDNSSNTDACSFMISVLDTISPTLTCPGDVTLTANPGSSTAQGGTAVNPINQSDNCPGTNLAYSLSGATTGIGTGSAMGENFNIGQTLVSYTLTDASGNTATCSFTVTVEQATSGDLLVCPSDRSAFTLANDCGNTLDNLDPILLIDPSLVASIEWTLQGATQGSGTNNPNGTFFNLGATIIEYIVTSTSGQKDTCTYTVIVVDNQAPTVNSCPQDITINTEAGTCQAAVNFNNPDATDNCGPVIITSSIASGTNFDVGTTMVTFNIADPQGNSTTCSFLITVEDNEAPQLSCPPADMVTIPTGDCNATVTWPTIQATDNCSDVTINASHQSGDLFPVGTTTVIVLATDEAGNQTNCSFDVVVEDDQAPAFDNIPDDMTVNLAANQCQINVSWSPVTAIDNCPGTVVICSEISGSAFSPGTTVVVCTATDAAGNSVQDEFSVTVVDNIAPTADCRAEIVVREDGTIVSDPDNVITNVTPLDDCGGVQISFNEPEGQDACGPVVVSQSDPNSPSSGDTFAVGVYDITYVFEDLFSNTSECTFRVTVEALPQITASASDDDVCEGSTISLSGNMIPGASCTWFTPGGDPLNGTSPVLPNLTLNDGGVYALICSTDNGCTREASVEVTVNAFPDLELSSNSPICDGNLSLTASETSGLTSIQSWAWSGPCGFTSSEQNPDLSGIDPSCAGTYTLIATSTSGCSTTSTVEVEVSSIPTPTLMNECADVVCVNENCFLIGTNYANSTQQFNWSASPATGAGLPVDTDDNIIMISPDLPGTYTYSYSVLVDGCETETVSLTVIVEGAPDAVDDEYSTLIDAPFQGLVGINDTTNQNLNPIYEVLDQADHGFVIMTPQGTFTYTPVSGYVGEDEFTYQVCHDCNDTSCDTATVRFNVIFEGECQVPNLISPNGDGINDVLKILCLDSGDFPDNELIIFNIWGDQVFQATQYQNNWDGTLDGDGSSDLPDGTYYYILKKNRSGKGDKGYITILR